MSEKSYIFGLCASYLIFNICDGIEDFGSFAYRFYGVICEATALKGDEQIRVLVVDGHCVVFAVKSHCVACGIFRVM